MSVLERILLAIVYLGMATLVVKTGSAPQPPEIKVRCCSMNRSSALDDNLKLAIIADLKQWLARAIVPVLLVTHDRGEAPPSASACC